MRTKILTTIKENIGITNKDDSFRILSKRAKFRRTKKSLGIFIREKYIFLCNITAGKATSEEVANFRLNAKAVGSQQESTVN